MPGAVSKSFAAAGKCRDASVRRNLANAITLTGICHVDRSVSSDRNAKRIGEPTRRRRDPSPAMVVTLAFQPSGVGTGLCL